MTRPSVVRFLAAGAMAAALVTAGAVPATAAPGEHGATRTTTGIARAVLGTEALPDLAVLLDAFDPADEEPFAVLEVFPGNGYECFADDRIAATFDGLTAATATGTTGLTCIAEGLPDVQGSIVVDVQYSGTGKLIRHTAAGRGVDCVLHTRDRTATVSGTGRLVIPDLGIDVALTPKEGSLTEITAICAPA